MTSRECACDEERKCTQQKHCEQTLHSCSSLNTNVVHQRYCPDRDQTRGESAAMYVLLQDSVQHGPLNTWREHLHQPSDRDCRERAHRYIDDAEDPAGEIGDITAKQSLAIDDLATGSGVKRAKFRIAKSDERQRSGATYKAEHRASGPCLGDPLANRDDPARAENCPEGKAKKLHRSKSASQWSLLAGYFHKQEPVSMKRNSLV